jgi:hypothetical protein
MLEVCYWASSEEWVCINYKFVTTNPLILELMMTFHSYFSNVNKIFEKLNCQLWKMEIFFLVTFDGQNALKFELAKGKEEILNLLTLLQDTKHNISHSLFLYLLFTIYYSRPTSPKKGGGRWVNIHIDLLMNQTLC